MSANFFNTFLENHLHQNVNYLIFLDLVLKQNS